MGRSAHGRVGARPLACSTHRKRPSDRPALPGLQALRSGLRALKAVGVSGVSVDVHWGLVEGKEPGSYDWAAYKQLLKVIRDVGLRIKVWATAGRPSLPLGLAQPRSGAQHRP